MNSKQATTVRRQVEAALSKTDLTRIGKETGFTQRLRTVTPHRLVLAIVGAMAFRKVETIADLQRSFHAVAGVGVEYKPFHNQLVKETFPVFMYAVFESLLGQLAGQTLAAVPGHALRRFEDIVIQDGSSFAVHEALKTHFPGRFTTVSPAAVELHATVSLLHGQALSVSIAPDSQGERDFLPAPEQLRGKLFLADRGYMDLTFCAGVVAAGGSFVIRFARSINPIVVGGTIGSRPLRARWIGGNLRNLAKALRGRSADLDVGWVVDGAELPIRLILSWNKATAEHMILATNLPREAFDLESVRALYRLRWQIELLFKEWKSYANLKAFCTRKAPIAEGLIWAALCAALLKRFLAHAAQVVHRAEISTRITAMSLAHHLPQLLEALLHGRPIRRLLDQLLAFLAGSCKRAHPARDRTTGRLSSGLRPTYLNARLATCIAKN